MEASPATLPCRLNQVSAGCSTLLGIGAATSLVLGEGCWWRKIMAIVVGVTVARRAIGHGEVFVGGLA